MSTLRRQQVRLVAAHIVDSATFAAFYIWFAHGQHAERNPIILAAMAVGGIAGAVAFKMGIIGWIVWRSGRPLGRNRIGRVARWYDRHPGAVAFHHNYRVVGLSLGAAVGCVGAGFNIAAILDSATGFVIAGVPTLLWAVAAVTIGVWVYAALMAWVLLRVVRKSHMFSRAVAE